MKRVIKWLVLSGVAAVLVMAVCQRLAEEQGPTRIEFNAFVADVRAGRVAQVEVVQRTGHTDFRIDRTTEQGVREHVIAQGTLDAELQRELDQHGVPVRHVQAVAERGWSCGGPR